MAAAPQLSIRSRAAGVQSGGSSAQAGIRLRCPRCTANLASFCCAKCGLEMKNEYGIIRSLAPDRAEYYAQFIRDYELIRSAEGRGSSSEAFYLGLPYNDATGRNSWQWQIRSRTYSHLLEQVLRREVPCAARILDLGAGNCWLSFRLSRVGYNLCAVDLLTNNLDGLGAAEHYRRHLTRPFPRFQAELA